MANPGFEVHSPCGRAWFVPKTAVRDDYVSFLMQADKLSEADAKAKADEAGDLDFWFYEQFDWSDVQRVGTLIKEASPDDITTALDFLRAYAGGGPSDNCTEVGAQPQPEAKGSNQ